MKIVIIQADIKLAHLEKNGTGDRRDIRYNLAHMSELLDRVCAADIYVLPEMFSTAFITEPHGLVDDEGLSLAWMKEVARQKDAAVAGSVAIIEGEKYLNRFYFVFLYFFIYF